jgi:CRISPR-associated endonuclease/helicase Cas3
MKSLCLKLGPVYSRLADEEDRQGVDIARLPDQWRILLRAHQAQAWKAYEDPTIDVIFDTALTGDGKSLAGQLPMLVDDRQAILLYPTNELIKDQVKQVKRYLHDFGKTQPCQILYSERITEEVEKVGTSSRSSIITHWLKTREFILSNPDLFHLMSSFNYGNDQDKREFVYLLPEGFHYFLFDEFHIFGPPQVIAILNIMNYHRVAYPQRAIKYVFLSATPTRMFKTLLRNSGFRVYEVEGKYSPLPAQGYTPEPIVQPITLHLHSLTEKGAYVWAEEHLEEIVAFYHANPGAKGVFIVNSVAMAKRLVAYYKQALENDHGFRVDENTGLTNQQEKLAAMNDPDVQLIIATSTVDVGVDFEINLLIFESTNAGTFIQRLGRLGRHPGWDEYRAYALLPDWTVDRFSTYFSDGAEVDRISFLDTIRAKEEFTTVKDGVATLKPVFQPDQEYRQYAGCWGGVQSAHIVVQAEKIEKQWKGDLIRDLRQQYNAMYGHTKNRDYIGSRIARYKELEKGPDKKILSELNAFRGRSPLHCGIYDETDQCFKRYDLFFLLAYTRFHPISEARFKQMVEDRQQNFAHYRSHDLQLYVILENYIEEREQFGLSCSYAFKRYLNQVKVYSAFSIQDSRNLAHHLDNSVNDRLSDLELVCMATQGGPQDFKRMHGLNPLFPVYQVRDKDNMERSVVFGLDAFLAHSLVFWKTIKDEDDDELFIC